VSAEEQCSKSKVRERSSKIPSIAAKSAMSSLAYPHVSGTTLAGLPPVIDRSTRVIVLGSFPGAVSLSIQQYYAHPRNQFWKLLSSVLNDELVSLPYEERLSRLLRHRIGLWDVIAGCNRVGSLDSAIRNAQANDFSFLRTQCPNLFRACFNGKTAGKQAPLFSQAGFETLILPSSSPAHMQMTFAQKLTAWRGIIHGISDTPDPVHP
jgi:TDG/mug DNA glycosylase family protein